MLFALALYQKIYYNQTTNTKRKRKIKMTKFQPEVLDENGKLRLRYNNLKKKTKLEKRMLANKIFDLGMKMLESEYGLQTK